MTPEALAAMIRIHQNQLFRYLRWLGADYDLAEDLLQETFLSAYESKQQPDRDEVAAQAAWLRVIARNTFLQHCRKTRRQKVRYDADLIKKAESTWKTDFLRDGDGFDYVEALRHCVDRVDGIARVVLNSFYVDKKSRKEIAKKCCRSEDGIKSMLSRIRFSLASCIEKRLRLEEMP